MTGKTRDRISRDLVDALYFAPALDDACKVIAAGYAELRKLISFDAGAYLTMDPANWSLGLGHLVDNDPALAQQYLDRYWTMDPYVTHATALKRPNRAI